MSRQSRAAGLVADTGSASEPRSRETAFRVVQLIACLRHGGRLHGTSSKEGKRSSAQNDLAPAGPRTIKERSLELAGGREFPRIVSSLDGRGHQLVQFRTLPVV